MKYFLFFAKINLFFKNKNEIFLWILFDLLLGNCWHYLFENIFLVFLLITIENIIIKKHTTSIGTLLESQMVIVYLFFNNFYFSNLIHTLQYVYVHNNILAIEYVNKRNVQMLEKLMQQTKENKDDGAAVTA